MSDPLAEIRDREAAATPGPWAWTPGMIEAPGSEIIMWVGNIPGGEDLDAAAQLGACGLHAEEHAADNLAFLAAARTDVPWLLDQVAALTAENRLLRALRDHPPGQCGRVRPHAPHRWLPNRVALECPGIPAAGEAQPAPPLSELLPPPTE
jgi:hypothetical protein